MGEKRQERVNREIQRLENRIQADEQNIHFHLELQDGRLRNVSARVEDLEGSVAAGHDSLERAAEDRRSLHNETASIDAKVNRVSQMTMKGFAEVTTKLEEMAAQLTSVVGKENDDVAALEALTRQLNETESRVENLAHRADSTERKIETLSGQFQHFTANVSAVLEGQEEETQSLKAAGAEMKADIDVVKRDAEVNSSQTRKNVGDIAALRKDLSTQGAQLVANGESIEALGKRMQQLEAGFANLHQTLQQHRQDIVEEMKKLTAAIAN